MSSGQDKIEFEGRVVKCLPGMHFLVELTNGQEIDAHLGGRMKRVGGNRGGKARSIKVLLGDTVKVEMSPYDMSKGRIVYRERIKKVEPQ